jgi:M6 family metalloprotease-like protein
MTKKLILLSALLLSLISVPAKATTCDRPYLLPAADQTKRTGTINVQVLFLKFPDSGKKSKGYTKDWINQLDLKEMNNYIKETSYGKAKLKFNINYSWVNMPNNSYEYGVQGMMSEQEENNYMNAIYNAATDKIDFSKSDAVWVIPDPNTSPYYIAFRNPLVADGKKMMMVMYNETNAYLAVSEILHTLGLRDLYSYISFGPSGGMDQFSIMSQYYGGTSILGYEKYSLGWLGGNDVICQESGSRTVKLSSLDSKGTKLILLPLNGQEMLGIEYRKKEKRDRYLGGSGILVYHINNQWNENSPINPIYFGNKTNINYEGININIQKSTVTVTR